MSLFIRHPAPGGAICDLVTPFRNGDIDRVGLMTLIEWQMRNGISGIAVCCEAGEAPTLSREDRAVVIGLAVAVADQAIPVLAGTGTNSTETTVTLTAQARDLGADAAVLVTPYYSKPTQAGIIRHVETVAAAVDLPLILCNVPDRTAIDLAPATVERLAAIPTVVGLIDGTGDLGRLQQMSPGLRPRLRHYSGQDRTAFSFNIIAGGGSVSPVANVAPGPVAALHRALGHDDIDAARAISERLAPLIEALEREPGPAALKYALHLLLGLCAEVRLPLTLVTPETAATIRLALAQLPECTGQAADGHRLAG